MRRLSLLLAVATTPAVLVCALSPTAAWWYPGELTCHWGMHAACALLPMIIVWRQQRAVAAVLLCLMIIGCWPLLRASWEPRAPLPAPAARQIRIASANLNVYNAKNVRPAAIQAVLAQQPEIFALAETISSSDRFVIPLDVYPHQIWQPQLRRKWRDCVALISKFPIVHSVIHDIDSEPYIEATLDVDGKRLHVIALHTQSPWTPHLWRERDLQLREIGPMVVNLVQRDPAPVLLIGDWNLSVASPAWVALRDTAGIMRVNQHEPATWRSELGPFGITIDHLMTRGLALGYQQAFTIPGSDHRGLSGTFAFVNNQANSSSPLPGTADLQIGPEKK